MVAFIKAPELEDTLDFHNCPREPIPPGVLDANFTIHSIIGPDFPCNMQLMALPTKFPFTFWWTQGQPSTSFTPPLKNNWGFKLIPLLSKSFLLLHGKKLIIRGTVHNLLVHIKTCTLTTNIKLLHVAGCDLLLGVEWHQSLGLIE